MCVRACACVRVLSNLSALNSWLSYNTWIQRSGGHVLAVIWLTCPHTRMHTHTLLTHTEACLCRGGCCQAAQRERASWLAHSHDWRIPHQSDGLLSLLIQEPFNLFSHLPHHPLVLSLHSPSAHTAHPLLIRFVSKELFLYQRYSTVAKVRDTHFHLTDLSSGS